MELDGDDCGDVFEDEVVLEIYGKLESRQVEMLETNEVLAVVVVGGGRGVIVSIVVLVKVQVSEVSGALLGGTREGVIVDAIMQWVVPNMEWQVIVAEVVHDSSGVGT